MRIDYQQIGSQIAAEILGQLIKANPNARRPIRIDSQVREEGLSLKFSFLVHLQEYFQQELPSIPLNPDSRNSPSPSFEVVRREAKSFVYDKLIHSRELQEIMKKFPKEPSGFALLAKIATNTLDEPNKHQVLMEKELKPMILPQAVNAFQDIMQGFFL